MFVKFKCGRAAVFDNSQLRLTIDQVQQRTGADYVLGGWVFDNNPKSETYLQPYNWLKVGHVIHKDGYREWRFTAGETGAPVLDTATTAPYILSGVPILVDRQRVYRKLTPDVARSAARQAVCWMPDGQIGLWASHTAQTRDQLQDSVVRLGARSALMMDGGGSVQARGPGICLKSSRILATFLLFWGEEAPHRRYRVALDAGHDEGNRVNRAPDGSYYEHEFCLDMAKRVKRLLEEAGVEVLETRPDGRAVSLDRRCRIANEARVDLFVSLHSNAGPTPGWGSPRGLETHIYRKGGQAEHLAMDICDRMREAGVILRRYPVIERNLAVLRGTVMTAVLIEHGFHTNEADVALLKSSAYRSLLALCDAEGILDYLGVKIPDSWPQGRPEEPEAPALPETPTEAVQAVQWAVEQGILRGGLDGDLMLDQAVTRRQLCVMLHRALGKK